MTDEHNLPATPGSPRDEGGHVEASHERIPGADDPRSLSPLPDPGLPEHQWRPTDVDPAKEKRAERQVAGLFVLSMVCAVLFVVAYFTLSHGETTDTFAGMSASNMALGVSLGLALLLIGVGVIQWARKLMADHEMVEMRHPAKSSDEDREATLAALTVGTEESGIGRRPLIRNTLLGAVGMLGLPAVVALRDLGPLPGDKLFHTLWGEQVDGKPVRVVRDVVGTPIKPEDLEIGDLVNGLPGNVLYEGEWLLEGAELQVSKSKTAVVVLRMEPEDITPAAGRENWSIDGIVCYSKICTHVGCPISLNERKTHHLLCPCHQSTFDLADAGKVVFGPASHALPQLHLGVDDEGYLVAMEDFQEPVGPSFWERG